MVVQKAQPNGPHLEKCNDPEIASLEWDDTEADKEPPISVWFT